MTILGDARRHFWLTKGMSRRLGVDLGDAIRNDDLTTTGYTDLVTRCRGCAWAENCDDWQREHPGAETQAPQACANAEILAQLRVA